METASKNSIIGLIILVLLAGVGVWYWQTNKGPSAGLPSNTTSLPAVNTSPVFSYSTASPLVIHHTLTKAPTIKGVTIGKVNNYSGTVPAFSNCDQLSVRLMSTAAGSSHFTMTITDTNLGTCPAAATSTVPFVTGVALKNAATVPTIDSVTINGASVPFKLVEGK